MKPKLKLVIAFSVTLIISVSAISQKPTLPLTADSLATGNYKDVLKSFFQLAFDKFTSQNKEIQFTSNPFAVMAKMDTSLLIDRNYINYTRLRNLNFSFAAKLDSSYKFNGFSSGVKYALINKRDETVSREFVKSAYDANEFNKLSDSVGAYIAKNIPVADPRFTLYTTQSSDMLSGKINFNSMDKELQKIIRSKAEILKMENFLKLINTGDKANIGHIKKLAYDSLKTAFHKGLLWTVGISDTTYKDQFFFSNILLNTQILKGIGKAKPGSNWEFDIRAAVNFLDDTLAKGRDLKRSIFNFEPGFNLVIRSKKTEMSFLEFKFSGSYYHNFGTLYKNEKKDSLNFIGTLRIRIINDIWIPLEIKYDPKSGNVFGFINVRANFTALGKFGKDLRK